MAEEMKGVAEAHQPIVVVEVVVEPVEVQVPLVVVPDEVRDVEVAVRIAPNICTKYRQRHHPSNTLGVEFYLGSKIL